jgi:hypothetical protein
VKKLQALLIVHLLFFGAEWCHAQPYFKWYDSVKVKTDVNYITNPWAGGLNFVQLSSIDLDLDGKKDLFVFDRTGNKVRTFINKGTPGMVKYVYAPSYEAKFPLLSDWAILADYNCDGKEDIFCYSSIGAGFDVYKNTSTLSTGLQFQKVVTQQLSVYYPDAGPTQACGPALPCNLYVSRVDIPALSDIDNDGDLDVITFDIFSGSRMLYHKNMSMEKYGTCDSLTFQVANECWGYATEDALNNTYTLFDTCQGNINNPELLPESIPNDSRHSGSCELCIDLDGDGDKEFIVGDISFNNLTMLTNGGTTTKASFIKKDTAFPAHNSSTTPLDLTIFPCPYYVDVDNDGIKDLLVSPNAANACENFKSIVFYKNTGANNFPVFEYKQSDLLQDNMIDVGEGAYPVFFDYNHDGLYDLLIGNYGYYGKSNFEHKIALFKNVGTTTQPQFELITRDYQNLSTSGLVNMIPAFGDLDGDGDDDLIIGDYSGFLYYYQNIAPTGAEAQFTLLQPKLKSSKNRIIDVGDFAAPQIIDVDHDGKNDLIIGARNGKVAYYHNNGTGTTVPSFDSVSHFWGEVNVIHTSYNLAYAQPFLFKDDISGSTKLLVGSQDGCLHLYDNIDNNLNGKFNLVDTSYQQIFQGTRSAPFGADIDHDGYMDLVVGNYQGGVSLYKGSSKNVIGIKEQDNLLHFNFDLFPNPSTMNVTIRITNEYNKTYVVEIYNMMGQFISSHKIMNNQLTLETQQMQQGMYLCKVYEVDINTSSKKTGALIKRLIIQH